MADYLTKDDIAEVLKHLPAGGHKVPQGYWKWTEERQRIAQVQMTLAKMGWNPGPIDGIVGPKTMAAYDNFRLREADHTAGERAAAPAWMAVAKSYLGTREIKGFQNNPKILDMWRWTHLSFKDDETPWCAGFAGACLEQAGFRSSRSGLALSYTGSAFVKLQYPAVGALRVSKRKGGGHVTFVAGRNKYGQTICLGGNQNDMVCYAPYGLSGLVGYYWPAEAMAKGIKPIYGLPELAVFGSGVTEA